MIIVLSVNPYLIRPNFSLPKTNSNEFLLPLPFRVRCGGY